MPLCLSIPTSAVWPVPAPAESEASSCLSSLSNLPAWSGAQLTAAVLQADTDTAERPAWPEAQRRLSRSNEQQREGGGGDFFKSDLPKKLGILVVCLHSILGFNSLMDAQLTIISHVSMYWWQVTYRRHLVRSQGSISMSRTVMHGGKLSINHTYMLSPCGRLWWGA